MDSSIEYVHYDGDVDYLYETQESFAEVWTNCALFSIYSIIPLIAKLIGANFLFGCLLSTQYLPNKYSHIFGGLVGVYLLYTVNNSNFNLLIIYTLSLALLQISIISTRLVKSTNFLIATFVVALVLCEYGLIESEEWLQIRGIVMVLVMKIISLADDCEKNLANPTWEQLFGYTLSGANILFGPWVSFGEYLKWFERPVKKVKLSSLVYLLKAVILSMVFLTLSNCWGDYFIEDSSNRWMLAYKEAFSFRTSHYFISFLAEAGMIASGFTIDERYRITQPFDIEFPSSLSEVVRKWNSPMHSFLKKYIYKSSLKYGKFAAIFVTFFLSSLLHGFEMKVSMVLINLGIVSYVQVITRDKLSHLFNCCIKIRPCNSCDHKYKKDSLRVRFLSILCTFETIFHLAYLGVLMDQSTEEIGIVAKWMNLWFSSHVLVVLYLIILR